MQPEETSTSQWVEAGDAYLSRKFTDVELIYSSRTGSTVLYRATRLGKYFVLKALRRELAEDTFCRCALQKEFDLGYRLQHPYIVQTFGMEDVPGVGLCIVLEWVEGHTLRQWLETARPSRRERFRVVEEICEALEYLHAQGVVHRDLKPENVMVTSNGGFVKLIDFGCSDADSYKVLKGPAGTRRYAAPELFGAEVVPDGRADLYSLGVMLGEMNRPWWKASWRMVRVGRKCRRAERVRRYASAREVREALCSRVGTVLAVVCLACILSASWVWLGGRRMETVHDRMSSRAVVKDTVYVGRRDTVVRHQADTIYVQGTSVSQSTAESDSLLARLTAFVRSYTLERMEEARWVREDTTVPWQERVRYGNNLYFSIEKRVKREVAKTFPPSTAEYANSLTMALTVMAQTMKEYNLKYPPVMPDETD